jgi:hypothetical protein
LDVKLGVTLREEHRLAVFEKNRVLRGMIGYNGDE